MVQIHLQMGSHYVLAMATMLLRLFAHPQARFAEKHVLSVC